MHYQLSAFFLPVKDGKVVEQGKPDELAKTGGIYSNMVEKQLASAGWKL